MPTTAANPLLSIGDLVVAQPKPVLTVAQDKTLLPYVKPGEPVDIGDRRINLRCSGIGGPKSRPGQNLRTGPRSWSLVRETWSTSR